MHFANVEMAYVTGRASFRKEVKAMTRTGTFECYATVQFLVECFVHRAHAAATDNAQDSEASAERSSRRKNTVFRFGELHSGLSIPGMLGVRLLNCRLRRYRLASRSRFSANDSAPE